MTDTIAGSRRATLLQTADTLMDARRSFTPTDTLAPNFTPTSLEEVYFVQDRLAEGFGAIGGWKIGAPNAEATPLFAPMPAAWITSSGSTLDGPRFRYRGLEAEIAFLVGRDLPPRTVPYTRDEVVAAMQSCHPAIEELESAYVDPQKVERFSMFADLQMHGAFVFGAPVENWQSIDWNKEPVTLAVDGSVRVERTGSNTSGDLLKLLPWLANEGSSRTGGLRAGQWITTGSWTGNTLASPASVVDVQFGSAATVSVRFA